MKRVSRGLWVGMSLLVVAVMGCRLGPSVRGSGQLVQEERQLSGFMSVEVHDGIALTVVVDPSQPWKVAVVGDDNLVRLMHTEISESVGLHVFFHPEEVGNWSSRNPLRVEVTMPKLQVLSRSGGGTVDVSGSVTGVNDDRSVAVAAHGGGTVKVRGLDASYLSLDVSGGGDVTMEGRSLQVKSTMSGGTVLRARELSVQEATLASSGGGSTELEVSNALRVTASGGGEVRIFGRPTVLQEDLSGGSTLAFE
ncbi:head GIN domain-containing protein [Archangium violaceum]|uniref:head GIN domain-containing protein n=1 Tax=Archangium violaceum TaxID=83451 RepID=UPI002B2C6DF9|nr:head GIN domain-containing protein [Archangium gephyra]